MRSTRRRFLTTTAATFALGPNILRAKTGANSRLNTAIIGYGKRTTRMIQQMLRQQGMQVIAVCEIEPTRLATGKAVVEKHYAKHGKSGEYSGCETYTDFRKLLERVDLDAVFIMTPDHTHIPISLHAIARKLHVYCEKPLTHNIHEGQLLRDAVKKQGIVFQTGSQQRTEFDKNFPTAVQLIREGHIGDIKTIHIGVGGPPKPCDLPTEEKPADLDWNLWLGPAPMRGYNEILCPKGMHTHYPQFRKYEEYSGGHLADMGAHHFDIAQWALGMDHSGPVSIEPPKEGDKGLKFTYANGVEMFHGGPTDCVFEGTEGTIKLARKELILPDNLKGIKPDPDSPILSTPNDHVRNWLDSIAGKSTPACTAEIGHRSATICHLANIGYKLRTKLEWDPEKEEFKNNDEANKLRSRTPRKGWEYAKI